MSAAVKQGDAVAQSSQLDNKDEEEAVSPPSSTNGNVAVSSPIPSSVTIDPLDALGQLCDQFSSLVVPFSESEQSSFHASLLSTSLLISDPASSSLHNSVDGAASSQPSDATSNTSANATDATTSATTAATTSNTTTTTTTTSVPNSSDASEVLAMGDDGDTGLSLHPTVSLMSHMTQLVQALSGSLEETLIRLEELQSIGLDQLQPAIAACGSRAAAAEDVSDASGASGASGNMADAAVLQEKIDELDTCFEQIGTVEEVVNAIDINLAQHEWRFNRLRGLYVDELGLAPQTVSVVNDQIATLEEFEIIQRGAGNLQKRINSFGDWVSKSVKDTTKQIATKSKEMPRNLGNTVRTSLGNLFGPIGAPRGGIAYDGYAEAKELTEDGKESNENKTDANENGAKAQKGNDKLDGQETERSDGQEQEKTWPLKPEEIRARERRGKKKSNAFGGFNSLKNVTFAGAMGKLKSNITNIGKKKSSQSSQASQSSAEASEQAAKETNGTANEAEINENGADAQEQQQQQQQPQQQQGKFSIKKVFKIKDNKRYGPDMQGDELLNWRPQQLPDIETLLQKKVGMMNGGGFEMNGQQSSNMKGNDSSLMSSAANKVKKDSVGSDSSGGNQLP